MTARAFSEYREIRISGYDFDMSDIQISEYEVNEYENARFHASDRFRSLPSSLKDSSIENLLLLRSHFMNEKKGKLNI